MRHSSRSDRLPWVTWGKAGASQLIVWHHLVHYGPLAPQFERVAPDLFDWLNTRALIAVQVFIVIAGYLAARTTWPRPDAPLLRISDWPLRVWHRYQRLARPYLVALVAAVGCAALARAVMPDPDTPLAPDWMQMLAHVVMLQDIMELPALSAGVWYVAIDLQLFALMALMASLVAPGKSRRWPMILMVVTIVASLCVFNLDSDMDIWAIYFFGAYGLGILAAWGSREADFDYRLRATALIGLVMAVALALEWRDRIALAGASALVLLWQPGADWLSRSPIEPLVRWLAKISYAVFLTHYPVSLLVNAVFNRLWSADPVAHTAGLISAWTLSMGSGWLLWRAVESRHSVPLRGAMGGRSSAKTAAG